MIEKIKEKIKKAAKLKEKNERTLQIAALITEALSTVGIHPILVGGSAVEIYTEGGYSTADIDFVAETSSGLKEIMKKLGFEKIGKDFIDRKNRIYIEFPSSTLKPHERTLQIDVYGIYLKIVSREDLIVDRLNAFKFWKSAIDGVNAILLLEEVVDMKRLVQRAREEDVLDALQAVNEIREESIRKKLSPAQSNILLEKKMKKLIF